MADSPEPEPLNSDDDIGGLIESDEESKAQEADKVKKIKAPKTGPVKHILLSEDVLCGRNGLVKVEGVFKGFEFMGKGHEAQDLDRVLHKLEHWVHLMHPRFPFRQTLERIEFLGLKKKPVKTYLKKIRMGLVSDNANDNDFINLEHEFSSDEEHLPPQHEEAPSTQVEHIESQSTDDLNRNSYELDDEFPDDFPTLQMDFEEVVEDKD